MKISSVANKISGSKNKESKKKTNQQYARTQYRYIFNLFAFKGRIVFQSSNLTVICVKTIQTKERDREIE